MNARRADSKLASASVSAPARSGVRGSWCMRGCPGKACLGRLYHRANLENGSMKVKLKGLRPCREANSTSQRIPWQPSVYCLSGPIYPPEWGPARIAEDRRAFANQITSAWEIAAVVTCLVRQWLWSLTQSRAVSLGFLSGFAADRTVWVTEAGKRLFALCFRTRPAGTPLPHFLYAGSTTQDCTECRPRGHCSTERRFRRRGADRLRR